MLRSVNMGTSHSGWNSSTLRSLNPLLTMSSVKTRGTRGENIDRRPLGWSASMASGRWVSGGFGSLRIPQQDTIIKAGDTAHLSCTVSHVTEECVCFSLYTPLKPDRQNVKIQQMYKFSGMRLEWREDSAVVSSQGFGRKCVSCEGGEGGEGKRKAFDECLDGF